MAGKMIQTVSHDAMNFPVSGSEAPNITLPEADLWSSLAIQNTVESSSFEQIYCNPADLLATSPDLRFSSRPSIDFTGRQSHFTSPHLTSPHSY